MLKKDLAVCIRTVDYSETSQIVTLFAKDAGKLSAIAKGSRRPKSSFDGPLELFAHGPVVYSETGRDKLATLTEFQQQKSFSFPARNLFALHCASLAAELLDKMTDEYDPHPELFNAFLDFLQNTDETGYTLELLILFQLALLRESGLMPIFDHCTNCKEACDRANIKSDYYFSSSTSGLICRDCEASFPDKIKVSAAALKVILNLNDIHNTDEKTLNEIERLLIAHFTELLHKSPRMAKYVLAG